MFIPVGTDNESRQAPVMNYIFIAVNFVIFLLTFGPHQVGYGQVVPLRDFALRFELHPSNPQLYQFISYAFLHANWAHILGNMFFLYIFGREVNIKMGNIGYLLFYLGGAIFSGIGHAAFFYTPVLGASGAVAAVTGAYVALFPNSYIKILYWFFFIGIFEIRALYFIVLKLIVIDNIMPVLTKMESNVAFQAHLAGYAFGVTALILLLKAGYLTRSSQDLLGLVQQWRRRRHYKAVVNEGYDPFDHTPGEGAVDVDAEDVSNKADEDVTRLRTRISEAVNQRNLTTAAELYLELQELDPKQVLAEQPQLDVANKLMHNAQHAEAAQAYEAFIRQYPRYPFMDQIQLMLGLIYSRYLQEAEKARHYLQQAVESLSNESQKQMCREELDRLAR